MPINIERDLPARDILERENIFVMTDARAARQDIRPLEIAIVNLMPTKIATETQLLRLLGNSPLQVNITLLRTADHVSKNTDAAHLERFYKTFDDVRERLFDGMIITGAPVEQLDFCEVDYWDELRAIMNFSRANVFASLYVCWGALAGLSHLYGIPKRARAEKLSGVYAHQVLAPYKKIFRGFDDVFFAPHSRYSEVLAEDIAKVPELEILATSQEAGVLLVGSRDGRRHFITGHLEYDRETLDGEYRRDCARGLNPAVPENYYPDDDPDRQPVMRWRSHAHLFFSNWLNYHVYQETPFKLGDIAHCGHCIHCGQCEGRDE